MPAVQSYSNVLADEMGRKLDACWYRRRRRRLAFPLHLIDQSSSFSRFTHLAPIIDIDRSLHWHTVHVRRLTSLEAENDVKDSSCGRLRGGVWTDHSPNIMAMVTMMEDKVEQADAFGCILRDLVLPSNCARCALLDLDVQSRSMSSQLQLQLMIAAKMLLSLIRIRFLVQLQLWPTLLVSSLNLRTPVVA